MNEQRPKAPSTGFKTPLSFLAAQMEMRSRKILVIEPNEDVGLCLRMALCMEGYGVILIDDAYDAITAALGCAPDLIITELDTRGIGGLEMIENIRTATGLKKTPILVHATLPTGVSVAHCLAVGADAVIEKPVGVGEVLEFVKQLLGAAAPEWDAQ